MTWHFAFRQHWAKYLSENIGSTKFAFFSAIQEDDVKEEKDEEDDVQGEGESDEDEGSNDDIKQEQTVHDDVKEEKPAKDDIKPELADFSDPCEILTSNRLIQLFRQYKRFEQEDITIGMGYFYH